MPLTVNPSWSNLAGKPSTVAGFGITDAMLAVNHNWSSLAGKPNTVEGFGITNAVKTDMGGSFPIGAIAIFRNRNGASGFDWNIPPGGVIAGSNAYLCDQVTNDASSWATVSGTLKNIGNVTIIGTAGGALGIGLFQRIA